MKKRFILFNLLLLLYLLLLSACNNEDELSGKTFKVASPPGPIMEHIDDPDRYYPIMTLEFLDGKVSTNSIHDGEGTYELNDNVLVLHFENENETLKLSFEVKESEKDFSEYSAIISEVDFEMKDTDKVSHFKNLSFKFDKNTPIEFIKELTL